MRRPCVHKLMQPARTCAMHFVQKKASWVRCAGRSSGGARLIYCHATQAHANEKSLSSLSLKHNIISRSDSVKLSMACMRVRASERWIFGESWVNGTYIPNRVHVARCTCNQCRWQTIADSRFMYSDAVCCYNYRIIVKHIFPKIQFTFAVVQTYDGRACWTRVFDIAESAPLAKGTICSRIGIVFLSLVASARDERRHTTRLPLINKRWRFYCAYNSIDNLWWCDDDNDDDDEFIQCWQPT